MLPPFFPKNATDCHINIRMRKKRRFSKIKRHLRFVFFILFCLAWLFGPALFQYFYQKSLNRNTEQTEARFSQSLQDLDHKIVFPVTIVCGGEVNCDLGRESVKKAFDFYESIFDVQFKIENVFHVINRPSGSLGERWTEWLRMSSRLKPIEDGLLIILVESFPSNVDVFDFNQEVVLGMASGIGVLGISPCGLLVKVVGSQNFVSKLLIHEIGHTLGATHVNGGVMNATANEEMLSGTLNELTSDQIKRHLLRVKIVKIVKLYFANKS